MLDEYIDAHHHLWKYSQEQYPWMLAGMESIRRDFLIPELHSVTREAGITGTVAVQARQTIEETEWLLGLAGKSELIRGVVGWVPLVEPEVVKYLESLSSDRKLKGVRHVLHDESDDFYMLRDDFNRGISVLDDFGLRYDILIYERHLPQTIHFLDRHPNQLFIVDHIAKPRIKDRVRSPWEAEITELARRENVYCKVSGMVTEADWKEWAESDLRPYLDTVLAAFGPKRLMFGSDWPVILVACSYKGWADTVHSWIAELSRAEQLSIRGAPRRWPIRYDLTARLPLLGALLAAGSGKLERSKDSESAVVAKPCGLSQKCKHKVKPVSAVAASFTSYLQRHLLPSPTFFRF